MASTDATPQPIKNQALRITFGLWLTTGLVNSGASGLDSEVSKDAGTFADCTNEATEIATSSGTYYLELTSTEMNADTVAIQVKSTTTNAITYKITIYPNGLGKTQVDVQSALGTAVTTATAGVLDVNVKNINNTAAATPGAAGGLLIAGSNSDVTFASLALTSNLSVGGNFTTSGTTTWSGDVNFGTGFIIGSNFTVAGTSTLNLANDTITQNSIASNAINAAKLATDAVTEIAGGVWDLATSGHTTSGTFGAAMVAAGGSGDPWATTIPGSYGAGTAGFILGTNLNALITSRMATYTQPTGFLAANFPSDPADQSLIIAATDAIMGRIGANGSGLTQVVLSGTQAFSNTGTWTGNLTGSVGSVSGGVTVSDKTGFSLANGSIATATFAAGATVPVVALVNTLTTYTGNTPQTGDSYARIGATGSGLTSLAPASTALSTAVWTSTIAGRIDVALSTLSTSAQMVKVLAATFDTLTISGSTLTLSNGATMVVSTGGRVTTP